jgi:hypothetical protein
MKGRPSRNVDPERVEQLRAEGLSWRAISDELKVGTGTARRAYQRRAKSVPKVVLEPDPIAEALKRMDTDWLYSKMPKGLTEPSGRSGPEVSYQSKGRVR